MVLAKKHVPIVKKRMFRSCFYSAQFFPGEQAHYPSVWRGVLVEMGYLVGMVEIRYLERQNLQ